MDKKLLTLLLLVGAATLALYKMEPQADTRWESFKLEHSKFYMTEEVELYRKGIFVQNLAKIEKHNADKAQTYTMGLTQFADLTQAEFASTYLGYKAPSTPKLGHSRTLRDTPIVGDIDWSAQGKVSVVKDQGQCGSCWAFSATGAMESASLINNQAILLSEQQLVDCSGAYGNMGCNGGWMDSAFQYVIDKGLKTGAEYPYVARNQNCAAAAGGAYKISGFVDVPGCDNLLNALAGRPISVAVDASNWSLYRGGVLSSCGTAVNHGVLLIGVTDSYWRIKNSWASSWGETGYIRLSRGNTCAVCSYPSYPTL